MAGYGMRLRTVVVFGQRCSTLSRGKWWFTRLAEMTEETKRALLRWSCTSKPLPWQYKLEQTT